MAEPRRATAVELVCPACRHARDGSLHVRLLSTGEHGTLACPCSAVYPVVDDVPIVLRDLDGWLRSEAIEALRRRDLPPATERLLLRGADAARRNDKLIDVYARSREGELQGWLRAQVAAATGDVLEIGAGLGATDRADVTALDTNLALLRRHPGTRVCGDAADPPFLPARFDTVVLANVLDSCATPGLVLAQADALLRPGGRLVVTCAYAFDDAITPLSERFSPGDLAGALDGEAPFRGFPIAHRVVEAHERLRWPLRVSDRTAHVHEVQAFVTEKSAGAA